MKKKIRDISVNGEKYVYWYKRNRNTSTLNISPKEDKTTKISIVFDIVVPEEEKRYCSGFYGVECIKDNEIVRLSVGEPKFVSFVIDYFVRTNSFVKNKVKIVDGIKLLNDFGYTEIKPLWTGW